MLFLNLYELFYQAHPWFKDINWDVLYEMEAAYKPEVNGELDTQNFMKYDEVAYHLLSFELFVVALRECRLKKRLNFIWIF